MAEETGPRASPQPACRPPRCSTPSRSTSSTPPSAVPGATRRRPEPRSGCSASATTSDSGTRRTSGPSCGAFTTAGIRKGEHIRAFPISNWTELDVWQYIAAREPRGPVDLLRPRARCLRARRHAAGRRARPSPLLAGRGGRAKQVVRYRTVGDMSCTGAVSLHRLDPRRDHRSRSRPHASPSEARHGPTTSSPKPPWKTARRRATSRVELLRFCHGGLGRRRQVDADRAAAVRLKVDLRGPDRGRGAHEPAAAGLDYVNLALLTDGLRAEREQGITIDVAYRYFARRSASSSSPTRPGHIQYTRNMVTGASTADVAVILVDARNGLVEQSRRHAFIATLLGIPHIVVCINKMDLVDWDEKVFDDDPRGVPRVRHPARRSPTSPFIPDVGAARRQRRRSLDRTCRGTTGRRCSTLPRRAVHRLGPQPRRRTLPRAVRHPPMTDEHHDYRGYAGTGRRWRLPTGRRGLVLPSGLTSDHRMRIDTYDGAVDEAFPPMSVTMRLADDIDVVARRHDLPARQPADTVAGHRGDGVLDGRHADACRVASTPSSTRRVGLEPSSATCATDSTSTPSIATRAP